MWNIEPNLQHGLSVKPISLKYNIPIFHGILSENDHIYGLASTQSIVIHVNKCLFFSLLHPDHKLTRR